MKYALATIACLLLISVGPGYAAPQWLEDYCWKEANQVRPALRADEREAWIANCIADHTPYPPKRRKYKKRKY
jgi:hypothetical protein